MDGDEGFLRAVDAGEDAEPIAPLLAQIMQRFLHRAFLAVAELGALEQVLQHSLGLLCAIPQSNSR